MRNIIIALLIFLISACTSEECAECGQNTQVENEEICEVVFCFNAAESETISRATDETTLHTIHFYMFGTQNFYRSITNYTPLPITLQVPFGTYRIYALANVNGFSAQTTEAEVEEAMFSSSQNPSRLVMGCRDHLTVSGTNSTIYKEVVLTRALAKINYSISFSNYLAQLITVQYCNMPENGKILESDSQPAGISYSDGDFKNITTIYHFSDSFYIPENLQGTNPAITDPAERTPTNAPSNASYLRIRTKGSRGSVNDYYVYLGDNLTDDFNIRRNTEYIYNIVIQGENAEDLRISKYTISLSGASPNDGIVRGYGIPVSQLLRISYTPRTDYRFFIKARYDVGESQYMTLNGFPFIDGYHDLGEVGLDAVDNAFSVAFNLLYNPPLFTSSNNYGQLTIILTDQDGYTTNMSRAFFFANIVRLYTKWGDNTISRGGSAFSQSGASNMYSYYENGEGWIDLLSVSNNISVRATPNTGYRFAGWYSDRSFDAQYLLSADNPYYHKPTSSLIEVYPLFLPE